MTTTLTVQERGVMLTDYFTGTSGVMLPVSLDRNTTCDEILNELKAEISAVWDHIEYTAEYHGFTGDLEKLIDSQLAEMDVHVSTRNKGNKPYDASLDYSWEDIDDFECDEYPMAIFTIEFSEV